jgi:hypothetical protein
MGGHYGNRNDCCKHSGEHDDDEPGGTIGSLRRRLRDSHGVDKGVRDELDELHVFSMAGRKDSSRDQKVQRFLGWRRIGSDWRASINAALMGEGLPERRQAHTLKDV